MSSCSSSSPPGHLTAPNLTLPEAALAEQGPDPVALAPFLEPERTELADLVTTIRAERKRDTMAVIGAFSFLGPPNGLTSLKNTYSGHLIFYAANNSP